jgi:hypothetical protein
MTAHYELYETKHAQQEDWHEFRFFRSIRLQVNRLRADRIMAKDTHKTG